MDMTPQRQALIDAHVAETHKLMADVAFELNDLVRFALSAAKEKGHKVYYPMDPVNECIRNWQGLAKKVAKLSGEVDRHAAKLGVQPFDPEESPPAGE
jgi:hypothetical protein